MRRETHFQTPDFWQPIARQTGKCFWLITGIRQDYDICFSELRLQLCLVLRSVHKNLESCHRGKRRINEDNFLYSHLAYYNSSLLILAEPPQINTFTINHIRSAEIVSFTGHAPLATSTTSQTDPAYCMPSEKQLKHKILTWKKYRKYSRVCSRGKNLQANA